VSSVEQVQDWIRGRIGNSDRNYAEARRYRQRRNSTIFDIVGCHTKQSVVQKLESGLYWLSTIVGRTCEWPGLSSRPLQGLISLIKQRISTFSSFMRFKPRFSAVLLIFLSVEGCGCGMSRKVYVLIAVDTVLSRSAGSSRSYAVFVVYLRFSAVLCCCNRTAENCGLKRISGKVVYESY